MKPCLYVITAILILASCSPRIIDPLTQTQIDYFNNHELTEANELKANLEEIATSGITKKREKFVYNKLIKIDSNVIKEGIDIYSFQHNYYIDIKGESDKIIYITAHYDKTDVNIFRMSSIFLNGLLDEPFSGTVLSQGAIDNGTGVVTALQLAKSLSSKSNYYTYRILLTGSEESGIRGARAHVAKINNEDWQKVKCCINIDCIGVKDEKFALMLDRNDLHLTRLTYEAAKENNFDIAGITGASGMSDHIPFLKTSAGLDFGRSVMFNLSGAFFPQRSYFTSKKSIPTLFFTSTGILKGSFVNIFNMYLPLAIPNGGIHSYSDNLLRIDINDLYLSYKLIDKLLLKLEEHKIY